MTRYLPPDLGRAPCWAGLRGFLPITVYFLLSVVSPFFIADVTISSAHAACDENHGMKADKCQRSETACLANSYDLYPYHGGEIKLESRVEQRARRQFRYCVENTDDTNTASVEWRMQNHNDFYYNDEVPPGRQGLKIRSANRLYYMEERDFVFWTDQSDENNAQDQERPITLFYDTISRAPEVGYVRWAAYKEPRPDLALSFLHQENRLDLVGEDNLILEDKIAADSDILTRYLRNVSDIEEWVLYSFYFSSPVFSKELDIADSIAMEIFIASGITIEGDEPVAQTSVIVRPSPVRFEGTEMFEKTQRVLEKIPVRVVVETIADLQLNGIEGVVPPNGTRLVSEPIMSSAFYQEELRVGLKVDGDEEQYGTVTQPVFVESR